MNALATKLSKVIIVLFIVGLVAGFGFGCLWYFANVPDFIGKLLTPVIAAFIFFTKIRKWATC